MATVASDSLPDGPRRLLGNPHLWLVGGFSVLYFAFSYRLAALKLLWYDELFTVYLARLDFTEVWRAVATTETNPRLKYCANRDALGPLGAGAVSDRLLAVS